MLFELCKLKCYVNSGFNFDLGSNLSYQAEWLLQIIFIQQYFVFCAEAASNKLVVVYLGLFTLALIWNKNL